MGHYTKIRGKVRMSEEHYENLKFGYGYGDMDYFFNWTIWEDGHAVWEGDEYKNIFMVDYFTGAFDAIIEDPTAEGYIELIGEGFPDEPEMIHVYFAPALGGKGTARYAWGKAKVEQFKNPFLDVDSLYNRILYGIPLSEEEIKQCVDLLGKRCKQDTKNRIKWQLQYVPHIEPVGIYRRVMITSKHDIGVHYVAGQDYPTELKTVRKALIG